MLSVFMMSSFLSKAQPQFLISAYLQHAQPGFKCTSTPQTFTITSCSIHSALPARGK